MILNNYPERIISVLDETDCPMDVEKIRVASEIGNWNTCLKHLLALVIEKRIEGKKTSKSWIFWKQEAPSDEQ